MKTKWHISFDAYDVPGGASTILEPAGCGSDVAYVLEVSVLKEIYVKVELDDGDPRIAKLHELLNRYGIKPKEFDYIEYSDDDLQKSRLLWMHRDIREYVSAGLMEGTKYDMEAACPNCGTGARQTSALYIDSEHRSRLRKHRAIGTWDGDVLVDGGMAKKLKDANVTGISFGEVRARLKNKKWSMVAREQILISHTMPPMRSDLANEDPKYLCKVCQRGGRMYLPDKPYRVEDLEGMQDFNVTWEWFGEFWPKPKEKKRHAKRPSPGVLVTPKVMNIFREAGVKTFDWTPVFIEE
ncbi:MAG: hypothetical protein IPM54_33545 [Polyangiaceae bacterium]|nr:hypothetical protein [Polyangiaceae bacterium]